MLEVRGVSKAFGGVPALLDVSLAVNHGEVLGLIGPNGSGKTTLVNCISGIYQPDSGEIDLHGVTTTGWRPDRLAAAGVRRTFQTPQLTLDRTVLDNVLLGCLADSKGGPLREALREMASRRHRLELRQEALEILAALELEDLAERRASELAGPVRKVVELARSVVGRPRVILLDEVASGMSTAEKQRLVSHIHRLREQFDLTLVVIEHDLDFVNAVVDRLAALSAGQMVASGSAQQVLDDEAVREAYIGT